MNALSEDRLKSFLERNRNRISQQPDSSSIDCLDKNVLVSPANNIDKTSDIENTKIDSSQVAENFSLTQNTIPNMRASNIQNNENKRGRKERTETQITTTYDSTNSSDGYGQRFETQSHLTTNETPKNVPKTSSSLRSSRLFTKTNDITGKLKPQLNKRLYSASPSSVVPLGSSLTTKSGNRIDNYIQGRKKAQSKIRSKVRSLSNEASLILKPSKTGYNGLDNSSTKHQEVESIMGSSINKGSRRTPSSSKSAVSNHFTKEKSSTIFSAQEKKKPYYPKKNNPAISKASETREFNYEEVENSNRKDRSKSKTSSVVARPRSKSKGNSKSKSQSKPRTPCISPIRVSQDKPKKELTPTAIRNTQRGRTRDKSTNKEDSKFFPDSSQRLAILDSNLNNGHKFKKEIKNLIGVIKQEREQISQEVEAMTKELKKYKSAYKKLKRKVQTEQKAREDTNQEKVEINSFNISKIKSEDIPSVQTPDQVEERMFLPLTINELTQYIENSVPVQNEENIETLLSKIDLVHTDVETILSKNENDIKSLQKIQGPKSFELRKTYVNQYIVKEMNLKSSLFFQDANIEDTAEGKPNLIDLLTAQREIIYFLVKKIQIEDQQRLKTEEQASRVMSYMEKTVKQLECKNTSFRKKEPFSQLDLNKSTTSQSTCKFDMINHSMEFR